MAEKSERRQEHMVGFSRRSDELTIVLVQIPSRHCRCNAPILRIGKRHIFDINQARMKHIHGIIYINLIKLNESIRLSLGTSQF